MLHCAEGCQEVIKHILWGQTGCTQKPRACFQLHDLAPVLWSVRDFLLCKTDKTCSRPPGDSWGLKIWLRLYEVLRTVPCSLKGLLVVVLKMISLRWLVLRCGEFRLPLSSHKIWWPVTAHELITWEFSFLNFRLNKKLENILTVVNSMPPPPESLSNCPHFIVESEASWLSAITYVHFGKIGSSRT